MNEEKLTKFVKLLASVDFKSFVTKKDMDSFAQELVKTINSLQESTFKVSDETKQELQDNYKSFTDSLDTKIATIEQTKTKDNNNELQAVLALLNDTKALADRLGKVEVKNGKTPVKGVDYFDGETPVKGVDYFDGLPGKNGNEIAAEEIVTKLTEKDGLLPMKTVKGLTELVKHVATLPTHSGDSSNAISLLQSGVLVKSSAAKINFTGATLTQVGDTTNVTITGGGGVTFVDNLTPTGTINGSNGIFTIPNNPGTSLHLYLNGLRLTNLVDYTISVSTITMTTIPFPGDVLICDYHY